MSSEEGLAILQQNDNDSPDMILLDINLPGMDGLELVSKLKAHPEYHYQYRSSSSPFTIRWKTRSRASIVETTISPNRTGRRVDRSVNAMLRIRGLYRSLSHERQVNRKLTRTIDRMEKLRNLLGRSPQMRRICELIEDVSTSDSHVSDFKENPAQERKLFHNDPRGKPEKQRALCGDKTAAYAETLLHSELLATKKGRSQGLSGENPAVSSRRMVEPYFLMKSVR